MTKIHKTKIGLTLVASALVIMGCQPRSSVPLAPVAPPPATAPVAPVAPVAVTEPGPASASPEVASNVFRNVCINGASPASLSMVRDPNTGSWYDTQRNIAIRDTGGVCAIVFGSTASLASIQTAFPGEEEGINPVRPTGASKYNTPLYAVAYTRG